MKDGRPFRYISGSIHYFRVPEQFWHDRIYKMKLAGLNAIDVYVEWSSHEPEPGSYNFDGNNNLQKFLQTAHDLDMLVILRPGPYIDAERDMGGLPYWLLRIDPKMQLRSYNDDFVKSVDNWFKVLLPLIEPFLYNNGGPIITIQVENEYGSTGFCDVHYKSHLRDFFKKYLKDNVVLFTTDGNSEKALMCGRIDQVLSTFDFGPGTNISSMVDLMHWHQENGPIVNSEFYSGWLDHWGQPHAQVDSTIFVKTFIEMLKANFSINIYMFHGGTSFGFTAGSNLGENFLSCPTSYDYDAPLSEAGDPTPKYYAIRNAIGKYLPLPPDLEPEPAPKMESDSIPLKKIAGLWDYLALNTKVVHSVYPKSFEDLYHHFGLVNYRTNINFTTTRPALLTIKDIADRGYVYVNKVFQGILSRELKIYSLPILAVKGDTINIIVENQGRVAIGSGLADRKGIFKNVTLGSRTLLNWEMRPLNLESKSLRKLKKIKSRVFSYAPAFYIGHFNISDKTPIHDTFLKVQGFYKGVAILNNFNLGRYWPIVGPQVTLYAPSVLFHKKNTIILLELEYADCDNICAVKFVKEHEINGTTPSVH